MLIKPLIFGISGTYLTTQERDLFTQNPVSGFILFKRNIASHEQLINLITELKGLYNHNPLIITDQEGGRVARLKPPLLSTIYPAPSMFGEIHQTEGIEKARLAVFENYYQLMLDLKKYNIDSPCAPVADLLYQAADNVIGDRSFGANTTQVIDLCTQAIHAIKEAGGIPIIKHIPGHGRATCDSHFKLPVVSTALEELNATDFAVFKKLAKIKNVWAMTAHIVYEAIDTLLPATISPKVINFIRNEIGFKGVLISDSIDMYALHGEIGIKYYRFKNPLTVFEQEDSTQDHTNEFLQLQSKFSTSVACAASKALAAGCDLVLHSTGNIEEMTAICAIIN